jgi:hypothetical protein
MCPLWLRAHTQVRPYKCTLLDCNLEAEVS